VLRRTRGREDGWVGSAAAMRHGDGWLSDVAATATACHQLWAGPAGRRRRRWPLTSRSPTRRPQWMQPLQGPNCQIAVVESPWQDATADAGR
jgi:hypothetical protein